MFKSQCKRYIHINVISCLKYTPCIIFTSCNHLGNISKAPFIDLTAGVILLSQMFMLSIVHLTDKKTHDNQSCAGKQKVATKIGNDTSKEHNLCNPLIINIVMIILHVLSNMLVTEYFVPED